MPAPPANPPKAGPTLQEEMWNKAKDDAERNEEQFFGGPLK